MAKKMNRGISMLLVGLLLFTLLPVAAFTTDADEYSAFESDLIIDEDTIFLDVDDEVVLQPDDSEDMIPIDPDTVEYIDIEYALRSGRFEGEFTGDDIVGELYDLREANTKRFLMSDGSYIKVIYNIDVHFQDEDGYWQDIDNSLILDILDTEDTAEDVSEEETEYLPEEVLQQEDTATQHIREVPEDADGYRAAIDDSLTLDVDMAETVSTREETERLLEELLTQENITVENMREALEDADIDIQDIVFTTENALRDVSFHLGSGYEGVSDFILAQDGYSFGRSLLGAEEQVAEIVPIERDLDDNSLLAAVQLPHLTNRVLYRDILPGVDLEYVLHGHDIKENIIVNQLLERHDFFLELDLDGLRPVHNEDGSISLMSQDAGEEIFLVPAPFMRDADGDLSTAVRYELVPAGSFCRDDFAPPADELEEENDDIPEETDDAPAYTEREDVEAEHVLMPRSRADVQNEMESVYLPSIQEELDPPDSPETEEYDDEDADQDGRYVLVVSVDEDWMREPERAFPVSIGNPSEPECVYMIVVPFSLRHNITFNMNGGNRGGSTANVVRDVANNVAWATFRGWNNTTGIPSSPTRSGHQFAGWFTATSGGTNIQNMTGNITGNRTFWARWNPVNSLTVSPTSVSFAAGASNRVISVTSNVSWGFSSNVSWLTFSNTTSTSFRINATANPNTTSRSGTVTVTGGGISRTISVTQAAAAATLTVNATSANFNAVSSSLTVNVTSNARWGFSSNVTWLTFSNATPTNTTGNGSFRINATANTLPTPRTGTVTVSVSGISRTITITQAGQNPTITFHLNNGNVNGSTAAVLVTLPAGTQIGESRVPIPVRAGWTFTGWLHADGRISTRAQVGAIIVSHSGPLIAQWTENRVITFDLAGGTANGSPGPIRHTIPAGVQIGESRVPIPVRNGFTFVGWLHADGRISTRAQVGAITVTHTGTLTAVWSIARLTVYQSPRLPGRDADGRQASDMGFNSHTRAQLLSMNRTLLQRAELYGEGADGRDQVRSDARRLASVGTMGSPTIMRPVANSMFDHFFWNNGANFRNTTLTNAVFNHATTIDFVSAAEREIIAHIRRNNGDPTGARSNAQVVRELDLRRPMFTTTADRTNGLVIMVHDTWGRSVELINYRFDGVNFSGTLRITVYDHFGLDWSDVMERRSFFENVAAGSGFESWYVLQHYRGTNNQYHPFISFFERDFQFSGRI